MPQLNRQQQMCLVAPDLYDYISYPEITDWVTQKRGDCSGAEVNNNRIIDIFNARNGLPPVRLREKFNSRNGPGSVAGRYSRYITCNRRATVIDACLSTIGYATHPWPRRSKYDSAGRLLIRSRPKSGSRAWVGKFHGIKLTAHKIRGRRGDAPRGVRGPVSSREG
jgi:hypothetical protein